EDARRVAEPTAVGGPPIAAHRLAPADHVKAAPGQRVLRLEHDPAVDREDALPAPGAASEDQEPRLACGGGRRQHARAGPVRIAKARRSILADIKRGMDGKWKQEKGEDSEEHVPNGAAHGLRVGPKFQPEIWR